MMKSRAVRWGFLALALGGLLWTVLRNWSSFASALSKLPFWVIVTSQILACAYVCFTMWSWRVILADLGTALSWNTSIQLFGVSQIGKYIPGGVWNIIAAAQIGRKHDIPASRSLTAMTVAVLISLLSGLGIGSVALLSTSTIIQIPLWILILLLLLLFVVLSPPVLNRIIAIGFRLLKQPAPEHRLTLSGLGVSTMLSIISWIISGLQIWVLGIGFSMKPDIYTVQLAIGAYALAWVAGFIIVIVPAGTGIRESVLGLFFTGLLGTGAILAVVLVSRITMTLADLLLAGLGAWLMKKTAPHI